MGMLKGSKEVATPQSSGPCYSNYTCQQDVIVASENSSQKVGTKGFHCFRRYRFDRLLECENCTRDITVENFELVKPFKGRLDPNVLVSVYRTKLRQGWITTRNGKVWAGLDNGHIWDNNPYYKEVMASLKLAENVAPIRDITASKSDRLEQEDLGGF